jgi:1,4-alpha-glucan branching enzyme
MSIKKQYLKSKPICRVTFRLPKSEATAAGRKVAVAGDFNSWRIDETVMKPLKNGDFTVSVDLPVGREYQYRFVVDGQLWITDDEADKCVDSGFADCRNSVVSV